MEIISLSLYWKDLSEKDLSDLETLKKEIEETRKRIQELLSELKK